MISITVIKGYYIIYNESIFVIELPQNHCELFHQDDNLSEKPDEVENSTSERNDQRSLHDVGNDITDDEIGMNRTWMRM